MESAAAERSLEHTPTWAVATVCSSLIAISLLLEHTMSNLGKWLIKNRKRSLNEALQKVKSELMLMGFISLLLTVAQRPISNICVPLTVADTMLPCDKIVSSSTSTAEIAAGNRIKSSLGTIIIHYFLATNINHEDDHNLKSTTPIITADHDHIDHQRKLGPSSHHDRQADDQVQVETNYCHMQGKVPLVTEAALHQLHIFIFMLAVMHVIYSVLTLLLGKAKMREWKAWEKETSSTGYHVDNDPEKFRLIRDTTFGRRHLIMSSWAQTSLHTWIKCFFRQFYSSVAKVDYFTLRHGFIETHMSSANHFNFQRYIQRSLEDDFKVVVGISPILWFIVTIFMLFNVHGIYLYFWISFVPLLIVLVVGAKLQVIVAKMALRLQEESKVIRGTPLVQPTDKLFWFGTPKLVLYLMHFTLFQNAFEITYFIWITLEFGLNSCYHDRFEIIIVRVVMASAVQFVCSYVTLPLYALVTQMGSQPRGAVFEERTANALIRWHRDVRERRKQAGTATNNPGIVPRSSWLTFSPQASSPRRVQTSPDLFSMDLTKAVHHFHPLFHTLFPRCGYKILYKCGRRSHKRPQT